jgi:hypothetical protein
MSVMTSTAERLRRATALWHAYLTIAGQRFELSMFLKDPELEKQVIAGALAHGDPRLVTLAQDWLRDTGQAVPAVVASRVMQAGSAATVPSGVSTEAAKPGRYLRGVR